jgi:hypothetical protein
MFFEMSKPALVDHPAAVQLGTDLFPGGKVTGALILPLTSVKRH